MHVNSDGRSVACLLSDCRLILIKDITALVDGNQKLDDHAVEICLGCSTHEYRMPDPCAIYLAFDNGRVSVVTVCFLLVSEVQETLLTDAR